VNEDGVKYKDLYRPEMQFSILDLKIHNQQELDNLDVNPVIIEVDYDLLEDTDPGHLDQLDDTDTDEGLIWDLDGDQQDADFGEDQTVVFDNIGEMDEDDILTLLLYDEDDPDNILWQLDNARIRIKLEHGKTDIPPGKDERAFAITRPPDMPVRWEITQPTKGVVAYVEAADPQDGHIAKVRVAKQSKKGSFVLRAECNPIGGFWTVDECSGLFATKKITVGCPCKTCKSITEGTVVLESVDFTLNLGLAKGGGAAGEISLKAEQITPETFKASGLKRHSMGERLEGIKDDEGALTQVKSGQALADIVDTDTDDSVYGIDIYRSGDVSADVDDDTGKYTINNGATPEVSWQIENPDTQTNDRMKITQTKGGEQKVYEYTKVSDTHWELTRANGTQTETLIKEFGADPDGNLTRTETRTITEVGTPAPPPVVTKSVYTSFFHGEKLTEEIEDPGGQNLVTSYQYYNDAFNDAGFGKIKQMTYPDQSWVRYEYALLNLLPGAPVVKTKEVRSWKDADEYAIPADAREIVYDYTPIPGSGDSGKADRLTTPRTVTESVPNDGGDGQVAIKKTFYVYLDALNGERTEIAEQAATPTATYGAAGNQRTTTVYYPTEWKTEEEEEPWSNKVKTVTYPDGRMDTYEYWEDGEGTRTIATHGTVDSPEGVDGKTTQEISLTDRHGNVVREETRAFVYGSSDWLISWAEHEYDDDGHMIGTTRSDGTETESHWGCCYKEWDIDTLGVTTSYTPDPMDRVKTSTRQGLKTIETEYTYDAAGRVLTQVVTGSTGGLKTQQTQNQYDGAGRLTYTKDASGLETQYDYAVAAGGGTLNTVTRPGGAQEITESYRDGRTKSVTGSAVVPRYYFYGTEADGTQWTLINSANREAPAADDVWEKTYTNMLGRTVKAERPGFQGVEVTENYYDEKGLLKVTTSTGMPTTLYEYDEIGNRTRSAMLTRDVQDIQNAAIDINTDRVTETDTHYTLKDNALWQETESKVYPNEQSASTVTVSTQRTKLGELGGGVRSYTESEDIYHNRTETEVTASGMNTTRTVTYPDSTTQAATVSTDGLVKSTTSKTGVTVTYDYDPLRRQEKVNDPRTGTTKTTYNANGRVDNVDPPGAETPPTYFAYDPATGRKTQETDALGKKTYYAYNDRGQLTHTWGDAVYPVEYDYDGQGRRISMQNYFTSLLTYRMEILRSE